MSNVYTGEVPTDYPVRFVIVPFGQDNSVTEVGFGPYKDEDSAHRAARLLCADRDYTLLRLVRSPITKGAIKAGSFE